MNTDPVVSKQQLVGVNFPAPKADTLTGVLPSSTHTLYPENLLLSQKYNQKGLSRGFKQEASCRSKTRIMWLNARASCLFLLLGAQLPDGNKRRRDFESSALLPFHSYGRTLRNMVKEHAERIDPGLRQRWQEVPS